MVYDVFLVSCFNRNCIISILLAFFIIEKTNSNILFYTILLGSAFYLFLTTLKEFLINKIKNFPQNISHFAFSLLILSILLNSIFSSEIITNIKVGESVNFKDQKIFFEKIEKVEQKNYDSIIGFFKINNEKGKDFTFKPELRIYNQPKVVTSEADINTNFFTDTFLVMNKVNNQDYFNIRYQTKPLMIWIWISVLLLSFGGLMSLVKKNNEK